MRFFLGVIASSSTLATEGEMEAIDIFNESLQANGHWILAAGICDPSHSVTFDNRDGAGIVIEGPVSDVHEYVSGFWIIEADSLEQARELAAEGSRSCHRKVELRPFLR